MALFDSDELRRAAGLGALSVINSAFLGGYANKKFKDAFTDNAFPFQISDSKSTFSIIDLVTVSNVMSSSRGPAIGTETDRLSEIGKLVLTTTPMSQISPFGPMQPRTKADPTVCPHCSKTLTITVAVS